MHNPQQDIALIRKYYNGELSPAEKNALEVRALDDPFLQDALDGYEDLGVKEKQISTIAAKIDQRTAKSKVITPIWGVKQWSVAASVLLCIALGTIYFSQNPKDKTIALNDFEHSQDIPEAEKLKIAQPENLNPVKLNDLANEASPEKVIENAPLNNKVESYAPELDVIVESVDPVSEKKDEATALNEVVVVGYGTQKKEVSIGSVAKTTSENPMARSMMRVNKQEATITLKGKIIDEKDGSALPGVSIKNLESGLVKQTDVNGEFNMELKENDILAFNYIGYKTFNKTIKQGEEPVTIALKPDEGALNEIVVVGYGTPVKATNSEITGPKVGWQNFKNYLSEQTNIANIGNGKVRLQFVINANGELTNFKIIDAFSEKAGVAAMNIVKNYNGGWWGSTDKMPQKTNITIKFK